VVGDHLERHVLLGIFAERNPRELLRALEQRPEEVGVVVRTAWAAASARRKRRG
jgi:hypothetical protein